MALSGLTMALVLNPTTISAANIIQRPDSIVDNFDYDEVEARKDTTGRTHKNFAKNENGCWKIVETDNQNIIDNHNEVQVGLDNSQ